LFTIIFYSCRNKVNVPLTSRTSLRVSNYTQNMETRRMKTLIEDEESVFILLIVMNNRSHSLKN